MVKLKSSTIRVEAGMETPRDAGSIPAASTHAGVTFRLKTNQARQAPLASLSFFVRVSRDLRRGVNRGDEILGLTAAHFGSESLEIA